MHINRTVLYERLAHFIEYYYTVRDKILVLDLCRKIIYNDPTLNCTIKRAKSSWDGLPHDKSLFHSPLDCGVPIGNLTSQVFADF
jgi:RNA-directed DNA polymerase